ncbi:adenosylhomocysteinase [Candidatus Acetothermia bacterium]|nr:adenosylhomocysteinase [Candidatus Acetothermia bacterium]
MPTTDELRNSGTLKIEWVKGHMPVLGELARRLRQTKPFAKMKVAICLHLEAKTAYMAQVIKDGGAEVAICGSNPLSTQNDVALALAESGVTVNAKYDASPEEYRMYLAHTLETEPNLIIDDGADLISLLHTEYADLLPGVRGGAEETTTGVLRFQAMEAAGALKIPILAVNDAHCKYLFDNRYGTGQSVFDGILRTTNLLIAGKKVVVVGYGWCGKGVAMRAQGLGAQVIICEINPIKALEAAMEGYQVMKMEEAAAEGDIFITVTGSTGAINVDTFKRLKNGAILANAGHFDVEIDVAGLKKIARTQRTVRKNIDEYNLNGKKIYLLAAGRLVNLAAADGHPAEIMDMAFALQVLALLHLRENNLPAKVLPLPLEIDKQVAELKLAAMGIEIDRLDEEQKKYLASWQRV